MALYEFEAMNEDAQDDVLGGQGGYLMVQAGT